MREVAPRTTGAATVEWLLAAAYVFLVPLTWSPFAANIQWSEIIFLGLALVLLRRGVPPALGRRSLDWLVLLYLLGSLVSFARTTDVAHSAIQYTKQVYLAVVYGVFVGLGSRDRWPRRIAGWLAESGVIVSALGLLGGLIFYTRHVRPGRLGVITPVPYLGDVFRAYGTLSSAEYLVNFLTFAFPLVLWRIVGAATPRARWGWAAAASAVLLAAAAAIAHSIGGLLVAGLFVLWPVWTGGGWKWIRRGLAALLVVVLLGLNAILVVAVRDVHYEFGRNRAIGAPAFQHGFQESTGARLLRVEVSYNPMSYYLLKKIALETFWTAPATGIGLGRFSTATEDAYQRGEIHDVYRSIDPHSTWLGRLAETGVPGALTLLLLWGGVLCAFHGLPPGSRWLGRALFAGILGLLINSVNVDIMNFRFLWVGLALLRVLAAGDDGPDALVDDAARA